MHAFQAHDISAEVYNIINTIIRSSETIKLFMKEVTRIIHQYNTTTLSTKQYFVSIQSFTHYYVPMSSSGALYHKDTIVDVICTGEPYDLAKPKSVNFNTFLSLNRIFCGFKSR